MSEINLLNKSTIDKIIAEIKSPQEVERRTKSLKRHRIYKDGGKDFLIEQIRREFDEDAIKEMRLAPLNLLKKICNKKASLYNRGVVRVANSPSNQQLVDYYTRAMKVNQVMQKANRYYELDSNTAVYTLPDRHGNLCGKTMPSYLYSVIPNEIDRTKPEAYILSPFTEAGRINSEPVPATGRQDYDRVKHYKSGSDMVDSSELKEESDRNFIYWTDAQHITTTSNGAPIKLDSEKGEEQYEHQLGLLPIVNIAKDRDQEFWATQGEDMIDMTLAIQTGFSDLLTISKHQGYSLLTMTSAEKPEKLVLGLNRAVWLKQTAGAPTPSIDYKSSAANISDYKDLMLELVGLLLSTNDMSPKAIAGMNNAQSFSSGFHALIEMSDTLEAREETKPVFMDAERSLWKTIAAWHNTLLDAGTIAPEARKLGKFSDDFEIVVHYAEVKPLENEKEKVDLVKSLREMGLITRHRSMKKLYPEMNDDEIKKELALIEQEKTDNMAKFMADSKPEQEPEQAEESESEYEEDTEEQGE